MAASRIPTRQQYRFMADLANRGGRYKDAMIYMNSLIADWVSPASELRQEEAKQLVKAYNNVIAPIRAAWRAVASIEGKNEARKNGEKARLSQEYRAVIELEISEVCEGNLKLLREVVIPSASGTEAKVLFFLMKGDFERYLAELKVGDERKEIAEKAMLSFETAQVCDSLNTGATKLFAQFSIFHCVNEYECIVLVWFGLVTPFS